MIIAGRVRGMLDKESKKRRSLKVLFAQKKATHKPKNRASIEDRKECFRVNKKICNIFLILSAA